MPIPNHAVGEKVSFDVEGLTNSRILPVKNLGIHNLFEHNSFVSLPELSPKSRNRTDSYPSIKSSPVAK
jgi:uncharacterized protein YjfI (DUF2170 family)